MRNFCETYTRPVLKTYDKRKDEILLYQVRCKQWSCAPCANINKLTWQARIGYGYDHYVTLGVKDWMMVTITSHRKLTNSSQCLYAWTNQWAKLSARMRRRFKGIRYVLLPELHEDGRVHWHMIASNGIDTRWLKDNAPYCGLGYMAESAEIEEALSAVYYVAKYVSKSLHGETWPANLRRIATSQKWPPLPDDEIHGEYEFDWIYLSSYPSEGMDYLRDGVEKSSGIKTRIVGREAPERLTKVKKDVNIG
ncbi:hypothetical protein KAR91_68900 [Candidatus Pacearchaeota archaeon]|nr:hypothetical protein [Candidatus Pacearchaeota archaeon]